MLAAVPPRGPTGDAFVSVKHRHFDDLPKGASVGTSSVRRRAQLLNHRPDLHLVDLRGNVETRLRKLREQNLNAIILAAFIGLFGGLFPAIRAARLPIATALREP